MSMRSGGMMYSSLWWRGGAQDTGRSLGSERYFRRDMGCSFQGCSFPMTEFPAVSGSARHWRNTNRRARNQGSKCRREHIYRLFALPSLTSNNSTLSEPGRLGSSFPQSIDALLVVDLLIRRFQDLVGDEVSDNLSGQVCLRV